jgi:hypothetical protein
MYAHPQIDLRDGVEPESFHGVQEQPYLDPVTGEERELLESVRGSGIFAAQRLDERG